MRPVDGRHHLNYLHLSWNEQQTSEQDSNFPSILIARHFEKGELPVQVRVVQLNVAPT
jgi:hypothetical protein